jgi:RNA polymerase sigma-70 factor, ECF subfamily
MSTSALPIGTGRDDRDRQLVEALRRRDADAAEHLVTTYQGRAYRLAVGTANAEDAEEGSWLYRIVANTALQKARRRRGRRLDLALDDVRPAIAELPPHSRAAVIMRDVEDWSCAEIAEVLRVSVGGVKTRLHRARLFIRKRLTESLLGRSLGPPVESRD